MSRTSVFFIAAATSSLLAMSRPSLATEYSFVDVVGPNALTTVVTGISNTGAVTGYDYVSSLNSYQAFVRAPDGSFTLFSVPGADATAPFGVNALGQIVGYYQYDGGNEVGGFLRAADGTFTLFTDPTATRTFALGLNDAGSLTQTVVSSSGKTTSSRRDPDGTITPLSAPGLAFGINNANAVVGYYFAGTYSSGYVTTPGGGYTRIDDPAAQGSETQALGINDLGLISGSFLDPNRKVHLAFVRALDGTFTNFADPDAAGDTFGIGINDAGQVSGYYVTASGFYRGFIATPLATAVPEPAAIGLQGVCLLGFSAMRCARRRLGKIAAARSGQPPRPDDRA